MNRKVMTHSIAVIAGAGAVVFMWALRSSHEAREASLGQLELVKQSVERQCRSRMEELGRQAAGFAAAAANDRDFSMKLLVDKDRSAPEVTDIARRYSDPMDCPLLSVTDSQYVLLSCSQFPASVGTASAAARLLGDGPAFLLDNVKGKTLLTLQAKARFSILDSHYFACAGRIVDERFVAGIFFPPQFWLIIKQGKTVLGMDHVEMISDIKDGTILINNRPYQAASFVLPFAGEGEPPLFIVCLCGKNEKP
jgi:hypothetical protein